MITAAGEAEPQEDPQRLDTVTPGELLALVTAAGTVADRDLERAHPAAQDLAGDLSLHPEAGRADLDLARVVDVEDLLERGRDRRRLVVDGDQHRQLHRSISTGRSAAGAFPAPSEPPAATTWVPARARPSTAIASSSSTGKIETRSP